LQIQQPPYHFNEDLKEIPENQSEWMGFVANLKQQLLLETQLDQKISLYEHIGMAQRILKNYDEAEFYLKKALNYSYSYPKVSRLIQNFIRLAHVYQWKKEFSKSQLLFDLAKILIDENSISESLLAAYHQHLGKLYFDQQYYGKAQAEFSTALSLRIKNSAPVDQIESSQQSLNEALRRLKNDRHNKQHAH